MAVRQVSTQKTTGPARPQNPGQDHHSYPQPHVISANVPSSGWYRDELTFANVTMETFDQGRVQLGCMSCHNETRLATDFVWTVFDHAYPSRLAPSGAASRPR